MNNHQIVNPHDHATLRILPERSVEMGDGVMCCITFPEEFRQLQNHYPILFQQSAQNDGFVCMAMLGFENGENLFLKDGQWDARYVPLAMDIQPFLVGNLTEDREVQKVVIDLDSPRISFEQGAPVFDENGMPTLLLDNISKKLGYLDGGFRHSGEYIDALQRYDLLEPLFIDVPTTDGAQNRLVGFHTINEENLNTLDAAALADLQEKEFLLPTYMAVASLSNLADLVERKNSQ